MNRTLRLSFAALIVGLLTTAVASRAEAQQQAMGNLGCMHHSGCGTMWRHCTSNSVPTPPYFALHPPVYYSYPVPRPYGYSPYPLPGTVMPPVIEFATQPQEIINPYVPSQASESAPASQENTDGPQDRAAAAAPWVENPYFVQQDARGSSVTPVAYDAPSDAR